MSAPVAGGGVDVLAVMDAAEVRCGQELAEAMVQARSAIAELIAADKEYDEARAAVRSAHGRGRRHLLAEAMRRLDAARNRRAAALSNIEGAST